MKEGAAEAASQKVQSCFKLMMSQALAHLKNCKCFLLFVMEDSNLAVPASSGK